MDVVWSRRGTCPVRDLLHDGAAARTHKPDGWVRLEGYHNDGSNNPAQGPWKGKNIYNTTALNQKATAVVGGASFSTVTTSTTPSTFRTTVR